MPRAVRRSRQARIAYMEPRTHFHHKLVLNQWVLTRFGIDPLAPSDDRSQSARPITLLTATLKNVPLGLDAARRHNFVNALITHRQQWAYSADQLLKFDENIVGHTDAINQRRDNPLQWKYFQWLTLMFVEIYLYEYFRDRVKLLDDLNKHVQHFNAHFAPLETGITPYGEADLNKICLQNATGSGKTLLMHVNVHQFRHYAALFGVAHQYSQVILITPNERLTDQHFREACASNMQAERLSQDGGGLALGRKALSTLALTEITKLGAEQGDKRMAVDSFGDANLLLVDEGHRGLSSQTDEKGWLRLREKLTGRGFTFEYSATFKEAVVAARDREIEASYARNILFDYGYRFFYEDGYGKDYRIFNLPSSGAQPHQFNYLIAALLAFYQQRRLYADKGKDFKPYLLFPPLWVFVGASVVRDDGGRVAGAQYRERATDVANIIGFLAQVLAQPEATQAAFMAILEGSSHQTGLRDDSDRDIFSNSFRYLKSLKRSAGEIYRDVCRLVFGSESVGRLIVERITGDSGELRLRVGEAEKPFGLINVGDAVGLADHLERQQDLNHLVEVRKSEFAAPMFAEVHTDTSLISVLIGSRKFVEGWDCWRVSSMGLMHTGKKEGSQIIQLFGRGVRLKGRDMSLMRSSRYQPVKPPKDIHLLETLNVFGVGADFMAVFRDFLREEGLPGNEQPAEHTVRLNVLDNIGKKLKMLRPKVRKDTHQEYSFPAHGPRIVLGAGENLGLPRDFVRDGRRIELDRFPKLEAIQSDDIEHNQTVHRAMPVQGVFFDAVRLSFLDSDRLYLDLQSFIRARGFANLLMLPECLRPLLLSSNWYRLKMPAPLWALSMANCLHWSGMALEVLKRLCERVHNYHKRAYLEPRLELVPLEEASGNLPVDNEYRLIVDASESTLVADILQLKQAFELDGRDSFDPGRESIRGLRLGVHLYNPLLSKRSDRIRVEPVALNDSEYQFAEHLKQWLELHRGELDKNGEQLYLLRNLVRNGIGFFEAGGFWPDFILWHVLGAQQRIVFVDPHGLVHEGPGSEKIEFSRRIKDVENRIRITDPNVELDSAIVAPETSRRSEVMARFDQEEEWFRDHHVFFMSDGSIYMDQLLKVVRDRRPKGLVSHAITSVERNTRPLNSDRAFRSEFAEFGQQRSQTNSQPDRAAVGCYVINRLHKAPTFGRTMLMKSIYLSEAHLGLDFEGVYLREAAGPYDNWINKFETEAEAAGWFRIRPIVIKSDQKKVVYQPNRAIRKKVAEAVSILAEARLEFDRILNLFAQLKTEEVEIITTLYAAWNDALIDDVQPDDALLMDEVRNKWHQRKQQFSEQTLAQWLVWMRSHDLTPRGRGPRTRQQFPLEF